MALCSRHSQTQTLFTVCIFLCSLWHAPIKILELTLLNAVVTLSTSPIVAPFIYFFNFNFILAISFEGSATRVKGRCGGTGK